MNSSQHRFSEAFEGQNCSTVSNANLSRCSWSEQGILQSSSNLGFLIFSTSKPKDNASSVTPPPVRNGGHAGTVQNQPTSSTNQLSVNQPPQNAAGPSPHAMRRGTFFHLVFKPLSSHSLCTANMLTEITLLVYLTVLQTTL